MKRLLTIALATCVLSTALRSQHSPSIQISASFPMQMFQHGERDYLMSMKYSAGLSLSVWKYADFITSVSFAQHRPMAIQDAYSFIDYQSSSYHHYMPFTTEPSFSEYGVFSGVRFTTTENAVQAFVQFQAGLTGTKYGTLDRVPVDDPEPMPGTGRSYRTMHGTVINLQWAVNYGVGLMVHITPSISIVGDLHAVNHFVGQPIDVYRTIGMQFGL